MLPFISYGMKNETDRGSSLWEFSTRGPIEDPRYGVLLYRGSSVGSSLINIFMICVTCDQMTEKKTLG